MIKLLLLSNCMILFGQVINPFFYENSKKFLVGYEIVVKTEEKRNISLDRLQSLSVYKLTGETLAEIKLKPVKIKIKFDHNNHDIEKPLSPDLLVGTLIIVTRALSKNENR